MASVGLTELISFICISVIWASLVAQTVKKLPAMQETWVQSFSWEDPLGKGTATHASVLAWRIPWTEDPAGYSPSGHNESDRTEQLISLSGAGLPQFPIPLSIGSSRSHIVGIMGSEGHICRAGTSLFMDMARYLTSQVLGDAECPSSFFSLLPYLISSEADDLTFQRWLGSPQASAHSAPSSRPN